MIVKLLAEHHLEFLSLKGGCRGLSESTHVKMPHCWKSRALAYIAFGTSMHLSFSGLLITFANSLNPNQADNMLGLIWIQTV